MSATVFGDTFDALFKVIAGAKAEIIAFIIAALAHWLFFGQYRVRPGSNNNKKASVGSGTAAAASKPPSVRLSQSEVEKVKQLHADATAGHCSIDDAMARIQAMPEKSAVHYNSLLDVYVRSGNGEAAEQVMAESRAAGLADSATYNTCMKLHTQKGDLRRARKLVAEMRAQGIDPTTATYNELLNAAVQHDRAAVWPLVQDMKQDRVKPNRITCSILLKGAQPESDASSLTKVLAIVEELEDDMDEVLLGSLIEACMRYKQLQPLRRAVKHARSCPRVVAKSGFLYGSIVRAYGSMGDIKGAWSAWQELQERGVEVTSVTIGCMVETLVQNGDLEDSYKVLRQVLEAPQTRPMVNAVIYCSVLKGFSHAGAYSRVWDIWEEMRKENVMPTVATFNALLDACARSRDMRRIPSLLEAMSEMGINPNVITYSSIIKAYANEGLVDRAIEVLSEMKANKEITPDEHTYNTVINGCARQGLCDQGLAILDEMCRSGINPSNFTLSVLVKMAGRGRQLQKAFDLCDELYQKFGLRPNLHVYNNLIAACLHQSEVGRAFEVLDRMIKERIRLDKRTYALLLPAVPAKDATGLLRAAYGLRGAHPCLSASVPMLICPTGGLAPEVVVDALRAIAKGSSDGQQIAGQLHRDLQNLPNFSCKDKAFNGLRF
jgi:pentatricopeptide repeat protein